MSLSKNNSMSLYENLSYDWSDDSVRLFYTPSPAARSSFFYVQETGYFRTFSSYYAERKNLGSYLILYTLSGEGHLSYEGGEYDLKAGQTCLFDCQKHHKYHCQPDQEWRFLWLHFNGLQAAAFYHEFARNAVPVIRLDDQVQIEQQLMQIIGLTSHKNLHSELICSKNITNILTEMIVQSSSAAPALPSVPDFIRNALKLIDTSYREKIILEDIAHAAGVSRYHLSREFKRHIGQTISDYITDKRLNYAKELLRYSSLPVSEIAYQCGISHVTHFINLFKRKEQMTPLTYRREWQERP